MGTANMLLSVANFNEALRVPQARPSLASEPSLHIPCMVEGAPHLLRPAVHHCPQSILSNPSCHLPPLQILGLDYKAANMLSDVLAAPALAWLPAEMRRGVLETTMAVGKAAASPIRCVPAVPRWPCPGCVKSGIIRPAGVRASMRWPADWVSAKLARAQPCWQLCLQPAAGVWWWIAHSGGAPLG